ncbi:hypothetical protein BJY01DRAFT_253616 [Aspergillus pseudoustus]|uniref:Uncharacterized protein n=1 Tax=Aspergillus pseudoustus TaxID=1810923 RepID=A0ABR4IZ98_9EURO
MDQSKWMKIFIAECTYDGVVVPTALARYVDREGIRSELWEKWKYPARKCAIFLSKYLIDTARSRPSIRIIQCKEVVEYGEASLIMAHLSYSRSFTLQRLSYVGKGWGIT